MVIKKIIDRVLIKYTDLTQNIKSVPLPSKDVNCKGILWYQPFQLLVYNGMERNYRICLNFPDYTSVSDNIDI